jgi:hypothetical protein
MVKDALASYASNNQELSIKLSCRQFKTTLPRIFKLSSSCSPNAPISKLTSSINPLAMQGDFTPLVQLAKSM